ncbi:glutathione S-transferase [Exophiala aquamarina CBS 119918]|uniref:Glutathione S-transferase n=1 Tax=Exophiala aquamarina CBS 119918 TaxID=1182545 RepID=A0A072P7M8_9EURO|nr:glutathione S-transferase [Exophiala aquamarina CBS 119918]KEF51620.1 glutathione S-transferase [Exophiala aquamarina CBS 119918]
MSTIIRPITLYSHPTGPNPWKVAIILEELDLPYSTVVVGKTELKELAYEKININGRAPAIQDPNTNITLWESGAIIEYLIDTYDKQQKLSFLPGSRESYLTKQWLYFQVSGQGPYFGQAMWFMLFHPEKLPSAQERYRNEIFRVSNVLDKALEGRDWLIGSKYTYADAAFLMWYESVLPKIFAGVLDLAKEYPNLDSWLNRIRRRRAVAKVLKDKATRATANK